MPWAPRELLSQQAGIPKMASYVVFRVSGLTGRSSPLGNASINPEICRESPSASGRLMILVHGYLSLVHKWDLASFAWRVQIFIWNGLVIEQPNVSKCHHPSRAYEVCYRKREYCPQVRCAHLLIIFRFTATRRFCWSYTWAMFLYLISKYGTELDFIWIDL